MKKRILTWLLAVCMAVSLLPAPAMAASAVTFADVYDRDTAVAVETLRLMGVLDGYGDGRFRPEAQLTRAQFCKMAVYAMAGEDQLGLYRTVTVFPDVKPSYWASAYINMAAKSKIIAGYPDGKFHPEQAVTVGQAVTILLRLLDYKDEHVGGVWPDSYMATGATAGLTDGVGTNGNAPLTRGQAARLFLNLLRADKREGGGYLESLSNCRTVSNAMLVSSTADGPEGKGTALELADGAVYSLQGGKVSSGVLNGQKGTLLLTKSGNRAITFVPDSAGASKVITLASAKATQMKDTNGVIYAMTSSIPVSGGKGDTWGSAYSWLTAGTSLTLYLSSAGEVEFVMVGGGTATSNAAVVIYSQGSTAGFSSLTNGTNTYAIYKNGAPAKAGDLRPYDVATYSGASNAIRVCDTRVTVYYEGCQPSPTEPTTITVLGGQTFKVLPTAIESMSHFKPGDQVTLLLTEDGQVAGAVKASELRGNAVGIVQGGKVQLLCGTNKVALSGGDTTGLEGQAVRVSSEKRGTVALVQLGGGAGGQLDVRARTLGGKALAENVMIFENGKDVGLSDLADSLIPSGRVAYARTNWDGKVDLIVLGGSGVTGTVFYGRAEVTEEETRRDTIGGTETYIARKLTVRYGAKASVGPIETSYSVRTGDYVAVTLSRTKDSVTGLRQLECLSSVPNSAWSGPSAVTVGGRTYTVSGDVPCYNSNTGTWMDLNTAHAYADTADLYVDGGVVRVIEVGH